MSDSVSGTRTNILWLVFSGFLVLLDQFSKAAAEAYLDPHVAYEVIPMFNLSLSYNPGASFGLLGDAGDYGRWFLLSVSALVSVVLVVWIVRLKLHERLMAAGLSLILGGAIGNGIDRALYGQVVDFLDVYYGSYHFPTFNIADTAITLGAFLLILDWIREARSGKGQRRT